MFARTAGIVVIVPFVCDVTVLLPVVLVILTVTVVVLVEVMFPASIAVTVTKSLIFILRIHDRAGITRATIDAYPVLEQVPVFDTMPTKTHCRLDVYIITGPPGSPTHNASHSRKEKAVSFHCDF